MNTPQHLGWLGIVRLGLVQTSLGAIVVLMTSTINRVMVVELGLAAVVPGFLIGIHYVVQLARPRFGHGSDRGGKRTPWIIAGMAVLGGGGVLATLSLYLVATSWLAGVALATLAFVLIGAGVGASGTLLLVLLATTVSAERRPAAATTTWLMMIAGFIVTTAVVGALLDPFSLDRLLVISIAVSCIAFVVTVLAVAGIEDRYGGVRSDTPIAEPMTQTTNFKGALREVLVEPTTRQFALFVFISMLAYSGLDVLLEPFGGAVFGLTPGETTQLTSVYSSGLLAGMLLVALLGSTIGRRHPDTLRLCMLIGCAGSAIGLLALAALAIGLMNGPLNVVVIAIGLTNGLFAVAAIGSMMGLMSQGHRGRDGVRMGVWGAAQALAFGTGAILGAAIVDVLQQFDVATASAYASAFAVLGGLYLGAALLAAQLSQRAAPNISKPIDNPLHAAAAMDIK